MGHRGSHCVWIPPGLFKAEPKEPCSAQRQRRCASWGPAEEGVGGAACPGPGVPVSKGHRCKNAGVVRKATGGRSSAPSQPSPVSSIRPHCKPPPWPHGPTWLHSELPLWVLTPSKAGPRPALGPRADRAGRGTQGPFSATLPGAGTCPVWDHPRTAGLPSSQLLRVTAALCPRETRDKDTE